MKNKHLFWKSIYKKSSVEIKQNLVFLLTWGAGIGGFMKPVNDLLDGKEPSLNFMEVSLLLVGIFGTFFLDNKLNYNTVRSFIKVFLISTTNIITMLSYSFMIPVLISVMSIINNNQINELLVYKIMVGLLLSTITTIIGKIIREFLD
jgi:hypothetical protein